MVGLDSFPEFSLTFISYFSEHEKKKNAMKAEEGSSFDYYFDILYIVTYYIPLTIKIIMPWISHYFLNQVNVIAMCVLAIIIMTLATSYIWNNFIWYIFTTWVSLYCNFWTIWIGEKFALKK